MWRGVCEIKWRNLHQQKLLPASCASCASDSLDAQNVYHNSGCSACTTSSPHGNTFHSPCPSAILNYIDFGAHVLKAFMAESWGPDYVLCEALTSGYNRFLSSRIRIASAARFSLYNYEVFQWLSGRSAHLMAIILMLS